jgi:hypothetical protein
LMGLEIFLGLRCLLRKTVIAAWKYENMFHGKHLSKTREKINYKSKLHMSIKLNDMFNQKANSLKSFFLFQTANSRSFFYFKQQIQGVFFYFKQQIQGVFFISNSKFKEFFLFQTANSRSFFLFISNSYELKWKIWATKINSVLCNKSWFQHILALRFGQLEKYMFLPYTKIQKWEFSTHHDNFDLHNGVWIFKASKLYNICIHMLQDVCKFPVKMFC